MVLNEKYSIMSPNSENVHENCIYDKISEKRRRQMNGHDNTRNQTRPNQPEEMTREKQYSV